MVMGSIAEEVIRTAPCPVLTVRHPRRPSVVPEEAIAQAALAPIRVGSQQNGDLLR